METVHTSLAEVFSVVYIVLLKWKINNIFARNKVKTAIVDVTKNRDTYTIYTYDNEGKRSIAAESMKYASNGMNEPLIYEKLSIYTGMPGDDRKAYNASRAVDTILQNNNVVLIDADFTTPPDYFRLCQEVYVVQDMDILNIPQLTVFLRELKERGVPMSKIKVIINKHVKCALTAKDILDGIATYTSYDLKMYDEYSNKFATFTDDFRNNLNSIINSIYPIGASTNTTTTTTRTTQTRNNKSRGGLFRKPQAPTYNSSNDAGGFEKEIK